MTWKSPIKAVANTWVGKQAGAGALRVTGAVASAGGLADNRYSKQAFESARNITNPNVNFRGVPNPSSAPAAPISYSPKSIAPLMTPEQLAAQAAGGGNGAYSGGGAAEKYDPNVDPVKIQAQRNAVRSMMAQFEQAFNDVLKQVDTLSVQKRGEFEKHYMDQQAGLDKNFGSTAEGIDRQFSARNTYGSQDRWNSQQEAKDAYDAATAANAEAKDKDIASVGQFAEAQKAELGASRPTYNVDDYNQVDDLLGIGQDVNSAIGKIRTTGAGLNTDAGYIGKLNTIAPKAETGSAVLKAQLDKLASAATTPEAKRKIAMTTIANAGGDQSQLMDYFERQLQLTGSDANQVAA